VEEEFDAFESFNARTRFAKGLAALAKRERTWQRESTDALMKARHDIRAELLESLADEIAEGADPGDELLKPKRGKRGLR
jgi:hypothetical protein